MEKSPRERRQDIRAAPVPLNPPEEQLLILREGKTVMEKQFLSFEKPNLLETDKALKWVETSGFDIANCGNKSTLFGHQRTHSGGKSYFCHECGPSFSYKSAVIIHMRSHMGEKLYLCTNPPEEQLLILREGKTVMEKQFLSFEKPNLLETDKALKWVETSGFDIANCGNKSTLFGHQRTHSGGKSYFCHECGPSFSYKSAVIIHMRSHMGEKLYLCT
ncbi:hypothetical protein Celaphus_00013562, partial [Cervus elaphus hippelaphus]